MSTKTTSLQTSKMLKEAGFRQDTSWYWTNNSFDDNPVEAFRLTLNRERTKDYAAPTSDELLEEMPDEYDKGSLAMTKKSVYYEIYEPYEPAYIKHCFNGESLPESLAQMWLHLRKEGLV